jgi:hypothetical protein
MDHRWIFGSMMATGFALFGTAAWIQSDRSALTSGPRSSESESIELVVSPLRGEEVARTIAEPAAADEDAVMQIPPIEIIGRQRTPAAAPPVRHEAVEPCSPWQEIGSEHVDDGVPTGVRRVRKLC